MSTLIDLERLERDAWHAAAIVPMETRCHDRWRRTHNEWVAARRALADARQALGLPTEVADPTQIAAERQRRNQRVDAAIARMMRDRHGR